MPLLWLSLAFLIGLVLGRGLPYPWWMWAAGGAAAIGAAWVEQRLLKRWENYRKLRSFTRLPLALLLAALLLGLARQAPAHEITPNDLVYYNNKGVLHLTGLVSRAPLDGAGVQYLWVEAQQVALFPGEAAAGPVVSVSGQVEVILPPGMPHRYGDLLELQGSLTGPEPGSLTETISQMGYPAVHLVAQDAGSPFLALLDGLRRQARLTLQQILPSPESDLLVGILLGVNNDLPEAVVKAFQDTGTAHIWAISGFNIAILAGVFLTLFGALLRHRRLPAALLSVAAITAYTLMVGASPSVVRAAVMGGMGMAGRLLGRRQVGSNSLAFTAAVMCIFDPALPWSLSFQLSFLATLGLVAFGEPLQERLKNWLERRLNENWAQRISGPVGEYFLLTLAAQATTLPFMVVAFQRLSLSAVLANPLVLPVQPLVMILGGLALLGGLVFLPLGQALAALAWLPLAYTIRMVELLAKIPGGVLTGSMTPLVVVGYYAALAFLALGLRRSVAWAKWLRPAAVLVTGLLLAGTLWRVTLDRPDGRLHLVIFNTTGAPAVLVQSPDPTALPLLINGDGSDALADGLGRRLPLFDSRLGGWLLTGRSTTFLDAMASLLVRYPPQQAYFGSQMPFSKARTYLNEALNQRNVTSVSLEPGRVLDLGQGVRLTVLADTGQGTAVLLSWRGLSILIPSGVPLQALERDRLKGLSLLLLGPPDLETQSVEDWQALGATSVVWSRLGPQIEAPGWVSLAPLAPLDFSSDGAQVWLETER